MWSNNRQSMITGLNFWVRCRTTAIMLGTQPNNPDLHRDFIASKAPETANLAEEAAANQLGITERDDPPEIQMTIFPKARFFKAENGRTYDPEYDVIPEGLEGEYVVLPFIYDYQFRGSFKESIAMLAKASGGKAGRETAKYDCAGITSYKKAVDGNWFVTTRKIPLELPETFVDHLGNVMNTFDEHGNLHTLSRPLRCETAKGPRTALATSEYVPAGTEFWFGIRLLNHKNLKACLETLDYKENMGMLQWRGGGKGTLVWTLCNNEGIPYEEVDPSQLTAQDLDIIARVNKIIPGAVQIDVELPDIPDDDDTPEKPKKKGRAKKEAAADEPTATEDGAGAAPSEESTPEDKPKKKGGRRKKSEVTEA